MSVLSPVPASAGAPPALASRSSAAPSLASRSSAAPSLASRSSAATPVSVASPSPSNIVPLAASRIGVDGTFSGYASLFNVADLSNDIIRPGAFAAALSKRGARGIRMLYQHRAGEPIGVWTRLVEDNRGLFAEGQLALGNTQARDILALLKAGALDGLSIGFKAQRQTRATASAPRILTEVDLWEISIVTFPMLPGARVTSVKTASTRSRSQGLSSPTQRLGALTRSIRANT